MNVERYFHFEQSAAEACLMPRGIWRISSVKNINTALKALNLSPRASIVIDGSNLAELDTSGALILCSLFRRFDIDLGSIQLRNVQPRHQHILELVTEKLELSDQIHPEVELTLLEKIGENSVRCYQRTVEIFSFIGETYIDVWRLIKKIKLFRLREFFVQLETALLDAVPVVSLVTFLIGVVLAYLFGNQIEKYGANIFIVDSVALAMCRELSPIIVAIIVAGRSGSAFTAQLGSMKLNEEIDALKTLGLSVMHVLVLPRVFALIIAMPLLVLIGDFMGIFGGMLIADLQLGITGYTFIERLQAVLPLRSFLVGMIKAPVFAAFIAIIGCRMGLNVAMNARSLGLNTTSTVVQSIVSVILLNAAFAVLFMELRI